MSPSVKEEFLHWEPLAQRKGLRPIEPLKNKAFQSLFLVALDLASEAYPLELTYSVIVRKYLNHFLLILALTPVANANDLSTKVGQFFIFGVSDNSVRLSKESLAHLTLTKPGGYILFRKNMRTNAQLTGLIQDLQLLAKQNSGLPAFIALDQEGGYVTRVPLIPQMPSAWAVAKTQDPALAKEFGVSVGEALRQYGFNMNLAPVLDVGARNQYSFLGSRAYTQEPENVAKMGVAFAEGLWKSKIIPVGKHFPGLGPVANDPHKVLVRRSVSLDELTKIDLPPFQAFSKMETSAMMISHFIYPKLDSSQTPATFSKPIVTGLLRGTLGYQGLIMTDDLMMEGARANKYFQENVVQAFEAGADLIMVSWSRARQKVAVESLISAVKSGRISLQEIDRRLERIRRIKSELPIDDIKIDLSSTQLLAKSSDSYKDLVRKITEINISKQLDTLQAAKASRYCLLPVQKDFGQGIYNGLKRTVPLSLASPEAEGFADFCDERGRLILFVRNRQDFELAKQMPKEIKKRTLLVNQIRPSLFKEKFPLEIQIFTSNHEIPELLSRNLRPTPKKEVHIEVPAGIQLDVAPMGTRNPLPKDALTNPAGLADGQSPAESASTPRRPATEK